MTPKQKAEWFLGIDKRQSIEGKKATFTTPEDAIAGCDNIISIFEDQMPPLTANYWRAVREQLILLTT